MGPVLKPKQLKTREKSARLALLDIGGCGRHAECGTGGLAMVTRASRRKAAHATAPPPDQQYIDKFGRRHSAAVLSNWSARALQALGVRPIEANPELEGSAPSSTES